MSENTESAAGLIDALQQARADFGYLDTGKGKHITFAEALAKIDAALCRSAAPVPTDPVAWQWRRKGETWSLDRTFNSEVFATTPDSEVRALYATAPQVAAPAPEVRAVLPPLPKPWDLQHDDNGRPQVLFTADQMREYAMLSSLPECPQVQASKGERNE